MIVKPLIDLRQFLLQTAIYAGIVAGAFVALAFMTVLTCYLLIPRTAQPNPIAEKIARYALSGMFDGADVQLDHLTLARGSVKEPLSLRAAAIRLYPAGHKANIQPALESENFLMTISPFAIFTGKAAIDAITIDNMKMIAQRDEKGRYSFALASVNTPSKKAPRAPIKPLTVIDRINNLHIDNAAFILEDLAANTSETIGNLSITLHKDPAFDQSLVTASVREDKGAVVPALDFVLTTTKAEKEAEIIMYLNKLDIARLTPFIPAWNKRITVAEGAFTGEIRLHYNKRNSNLTRYKVDLASTAGRFQLANVMTRPVAFDQLDLALNNKSLTFDGHIENNPFSIQAAAASKPEGGYDIKATIPFLDMKSFAGIWQEGNASSAQEWLTQKLKDGRFKNMQLSGYWHHTPTGGWTMNDIEADFGVEDMWILYKHGLAPAEHVNAAGHYKDDKLSLKLAGGTVSGLRVIEGNLDIADLTKQGKGDCKGLLRLNGGLQNVLSYLDNPIIHYKDRVALDLSKATGNVQISVGLDFPTTKEAKAEHVKVDVDAVLTNANLPDVVSGITLTGGPLALKGSPDKILLRGDVHLNDAPSYLTYETYFSKQNVPFIQKLDLRGRFTEDTLDEFGLGGWIRDMQGPSKYAVSYQQPVQGAPSVSASLTGPSLSVESADVNLNAKNEFINATLNGLIMGATRGDVKVTQGKNGGYAFNFNGSAFDVRPVLSPSDKKKGRSPANLSASINATRLITSDRGIINSAKISYASNKNGDTSKLMLSGQAGGKPVDIQFNEAGNGDSLRVNILDAGAFLRAMDMTNGVNGGEINVQAVPNGSYGSMKGRARIRNFTAKDVPLLGRLINALSLPGLFQLFTNQGIYFDRLRSDFTWSKGQNGSVLALQNGSTRGSSLGLTFEGTYNQTHKNLDIKGKVVPLSEINNIVKKIPLLGPLISGGRNGALVAANYTMTGSPESPRVFINPLSILTPGILRSILFEDDTATSQ